ncbi:MAG TPA: GNAT family N-acetyltransferase [Bryobacteraceae bacterium]|nr:GNAT family N-acetyltransferase [Bryobacteraceae bacterium]
MTGFQEMEANLRQSFRILAQGRPKANIAELDGVTIASLGAAFQMFNAAFLNREVSGLDDLEKRFRAARAVFDARRISWAFWVCDEWLSRPVRRELLNTCESFGMRAVAEMPGMVADSLRENPRFSLRSRPAPPLEIRPADDARVMRDFRTVGALCFHVPPAWFAEVFDDTIPSREFRCWVGYHEGRPVATAATVVAHGVIGLYNVAALPGEQGKGFGEAITRHAISEATRESGLQRVILQSTMQGERLYRKLGFREVSRLVVFNSVPAI